MQVEDFEHIAQASGRAYGRGYHEIDHATQEARIEMWRALDRIHEARNPAAMATRIAQRAARGAAQYGRMWKGQEDTGACKWGHPWTSENTGRQKRGRVCRTCEAARKRRKRMEAST